MPQCWPQECSFVLVKFEVSISHLSGSLKEAYWIIGAQERNVGWILHILDGS